MTASEKAKNRRLLQTYQMSLDTFNQKMEDQGGLCALCERPLKRANVDHDHRCCPRRLKEFCGKCNRGLCCFSCNKYVLGAVEKFRPKTGDAAEFARRVVQYLEFWTDEIQRKGGYEPKPDKPKAKAKRKKAKLRRK